MEDLEVYTVAVLFRKAKLSIIQRIMRESGFVIFSLIRTVISWTDVIGCRTILHSLVRKKPPWLTFV